LGLSNYSYLKNLQKVGKLLVKRKKEMKRLKKTKNEAKKEIHRVKIATFSEEAIQEKKKADELKQKIQPRAIYLFIQFQSMNGKEKFLKALDVSWWKRGWLSFCNKLLCCCKICPCFKAGEWNNIQHKYFEGKWPVIRHDVPDPSLIQWPNLGVSSTMRFLRGLLIYLVSVVIMVACFGLIMWAFAYKNSLESTGWKSSQCGKSKISFD
jgi:hypothetical protein